MPGTNVEAASQTCIANMHGTPAAQPKRHPTNKGTMWSASSVSHVRRTLIFLRKSAPPSHRYRLLKCQYPAHRWHPPCLNDADMNPTNLMNIFAPLVGLLAMIGLFLASLRAVIALSPKPMSEAEE